ncbi:hypothetical protein BDN72DRAFT_896178 [Pluteus cervinus]|uniref:Uncharacterized protein n=1 Tax=Pluteus cervinus TaxID=181527 RepID=A0ACD3AYA9_9AGAR|nr:hypothetical protein BDN72DRAFT_896178 [Pluteus cervinus]
MNNQDIDLTSLTASLPHNQDDQRAAGDALGSPQLDSGAPGPLVSLPPLPPSTAPSERSVTDGNASTTTEIPLRHTRPSGFSLPPLHSSPALSQQSGQGRRMETQRVTSLPTRNQGDDNPLQTHTRHTRPGRGDQSARSDDHIAWDGDDEDDGPQIYRTGLNEMENMIEGILQRRLQPMESAILGLHGLVSGLAMQAAPGTAAGDPDELGRGRFRTPKVTTAPKHRPANDNDRARLVREFLDRILDPNDPQPDPRALARFARAWNVDNGATARPCCTIEDFTIDLTGTPHSPWNQSAARVFTDGLIRATGSLLPNTYRVRDEVGKSFFARVKSLKEKPTRKLPAKAKAARRAERKRTLYWRRVDICRKLPSLEHHVPILERLGVDGMSSDESDTDDENRGARLPVFRILLPRWRSPAISAFLHIIDMAHVAHRMVSTDASISRGANPRIRSIDASASRYSPKVNNFVADLPMNAYRQEWLDRRADVPFTIRPQAEDYDFQHDGAVIE